MGLDMYAFAVPADKAGDTQVDFAPDDDTPREKLAYWRKFNHLHGWMRDLYHRKGGQSGEFNCDTVRLTTADLDSLYEAVSTSALEHTPGFFFGDEKIYPEDIESTLKFIGDAKMAIAEGKAVFYDSWW